MKIFAAVLIAVSASAFANHHDMNMEEMKKMPFDQHKKMMQEKLEKKSAMVEEGKKCVNEAKDNEALMECHKNMREEKMAMKEEMKNKMMDMKKKK